MTGPVLTYVSFIITKNRRYAQNRNMQIKIGYKTYGITLLISLYICEKIGVNCVSCFVLSIENVGRTKVEVKTLVELFPIKLNVFTDRADNYKDPLYESKLRIIGDKKSLVE